MDFKTDFSNDNNVVKINQTIHRGDIYITTGLFRDTPENDQDKIYAKKNRPVVVVGISPNLPVVLVMPITSSDLRSERYVKIPPISEYPRNTTAIVTDQVFTINMYQLGRKLATVDIEVVEACIKLLNKTCFTIDNNSTPLPDRDSVSTDTEDNHNRKTGKKCYNNSISTLGSVAKIKNAKPTTTRSSADAITVANKRGPFTISEASMLYNLWLRYGTEEFIKQLNIPTKKRYSYVRKKCIDVLIRENILNEYDWDGRPRRK